MSTSQNTESACALVDRFFNAFATKDLDTLSACLTPDAVIWHSFDGICARREQALKSWQNIFAAVPGMAVADIRQEEVPGGVIRRHLMILIDSQGNKKGMAATIFVSVNDGLISRVDEYISPSAFLPVEGENPTTLGLEAARGLI